MSESKQLIVPFAVVIIIGIAGYLAANYIPYSGDLVVENTLLLSPPKGS